MITATELYLFLRECVEVGAEDNGHRQTPGLWPLKRHDKGEFIHLVPGHELNLPPAPELNEANNPYRGLQSYDEEHAPVFFGRSQFVKKLAERVASQPLTVVLGASGTGKSSVVKAGLLSYLRGKEPDAWRILPPVRPGKSPLASLANLSLPGQDTDDLGTRLAEFWTDPEALATRVGAWSAHEPAGRLLLVVDQFEELITLCWDAGEREQFLRLFDRALAAQSDRLRVVLTLRSDFEPQFAHTPLEDRWMSSRIVVPAMTLDEYREVIEGPASVKVLYFQGKVSSQEFINHLIGDVANTPGALPLLSFTMSELYRRYLERRGDDRSLCEDDYERLGRVGGSLRNRANEVYDGLPDDAMRETMRRMMLRMISVEAGELARRRVPDSELVYREPSENERVAKVLGRLTEARLVVEGKESDDQPYMEPAHDELIRGWDKLLDWARKGQEGLLLRRILTPAADDWKHGTGGLWHANPRLALVRRVLHATDCWFNQTESDFVQRSVLKRRTILGGTVAAVAVAFLVLSVITWWALRQRTRAINGEAKARRETAEVLSTAGMTALEHGQPFLAMHQFAGAIKTVAEDTRFQENNRLRLGMLVRDVPRLRAILTGNTAAFSPDGQRIVTASDDKTARVWDAATGQPLASLQGHTDGVRSAAFSPDGKRIVTASADKTARVWDVATGQLVASLQGHTSGVFSAAFSPDGKRIVTASADKTARVWDAATGQPLASLQGHTDVVRSAAFSPDGKRIVTASDDKTARVWEAESGKLVASLHGHTSWVDSAAFSPDGQRVVTTAWAERTARVWDAATGQPLASLRGHTDRGPLRRVQPRRQADRHRLTGQDGAGLGHRDRQAPRLTSGAHRLGQIRRVQPRRQAGRHRIRRQDSAGVGRRDRPACRLTSGAHERGPLRRVQPRRQAGRHRISRQDSAGVGRRDRRAGPLFRGTPATSTPPRSAPTAGGSSPHPATRRRGSGTPRPASFLPHFRGTPTGSSPPRSAPTASGSSPHHATRRRGSGTPPPASPSPHFRGTPATSTPPRSAPTAGGSSPHARRRGSGTPRVASLSPHFRGTRAGLPLPRSAPTASGSSPPHTTTRRGSGTPRPASPSPHFRGTPNRLCPQSSAPTASGSLPLHTTTRRGSGTPRPASFLPHFRGTPTGSTPPRSAPTASGSSPHHSTIRHGSGTPRAASLSPHFRGTPIRSTPPRSAPMASGSSPP